jgi:hypothetical protein
MITLTSLKRSDIGRWMTFTHQDGTVEKGRLKTWSHEVIFIVFKCDNRWDDFLQFTGVSCEPERVSFNVRALRDIKTEEDVHSLEAGRELDIIMAEVILDQDRLQERYDPMNRDGEPQFFWGYPHGHDFAPDYSTSKIACFLVIDWVFKLKGIFEANAHSLESDNQWHVAFNRKNFSIASTFELAVCKAGLLFYLSRKR